MPRITRAQQKIFAGQATNNGVFGSLQSNDPVTSSDPATIQSRTAFLNGWNDATYSAEQLPPLEEFQAIQYIVTRQLAYMLQEGIPEWDVNTTYYKGSIVKVVSGSEYTLFESLIDNNTGNLTSDTTRWKVCGVSEDFNTGMHYWRADVTYGLGDWVRGVDAGGNPDIFQSLQANNKGNAVTNGQYWNPMGVGRGGFPLMTALPYDHELNETNWLRADTWSWHDGTIYQSAYQALSDAQSTGAQSSDLWAAFNVVGSPTITNGVVSGFSASNKIETSQVFPIGDKNWSITVGLNWDGTTSERNTVVAQTTNQEYVSPVIYIDTDGKIALYLSSNGTSWDIAQSIKSTDVFPSNQDVLLKLEFNGTQYILSWSTDGSTYLTEITISSTAKTNITSGICFGGNALSSLTTRYLRGYIDMTKTNFVIDSVKVWTGAVNVPYTRATNGWKIVSPANAGYVQDMYESTGVAWYYILDTANAQFKLPRTRYGFTGLRDTVGKYVPESLPNIKGNINGQVTPAVSSGITKAGVFSSSVIDSDKKAAQGNNYRSVSTLIFDASDSSTAYQDNAPVQQRATQMYLYFYVGNTIRNQTEIDVGEITEALNKKWDSSNMQVVDALPENPQTGVFYFVK